MHTMTKTILFAAVLGVLTAGCYTKLYRPDGAPTGQRGPYDELYSRYDSSAIDTTLIAPEYDSSYDDDYGWYYWGHQRRYPRWGFDFWSYSPGYYWTYYGFYDYYAVPWWNRYYDPWNRWNWVPPSGPAEPPSQRDFGRRGRGSGTEGGPYGAPPPSSGGGYAQPAPPPPPPPSQKPAEQPARKQEQPKQEDSNKREGRRGR